MKQMKQPSYTPTPTDIAWAEGVMNQIAEGGVFAFPSTKVIYAVSHKNKTLTLQNPEQLQSFPSFVIHYQTIDVFKEIGYTALPPKEKEEQQRRANVEQRVVVNRRYCDRACSCDLPPRSASHALAWERIEEANCPDVRRAKRSRAASASYCESNLAEKAHQS
jgi:hypothetical protein